MFSAVAIFATIELHSYRNTASRVQAFTVVPLVKCCPARPSLAIGSYLDSLSSGENDDDTSKNPAGPPSPQPKDISVNSYLDSLSKPNNQGSTSYGEISYGQGGINPSSWAASQTADGYLSNISGAQGSTPSPWDSGKSPSPWTPPNTPAKFAPVPTDDQASKDQGLLFFADVLSSQQNQQQPGLPREYPPRNADLQNQAIGASNGQSPVPVTSQGYAQSLPPPPAQPMADAPKYKSLYEDIEENAGVIRSHGPDTTQQQQPIAPAPQDPQRYVSAQQPIAPAPQEPQQYTSAPQEFSQPPAPSEPVVASVEEPKHPEKYTSVPQPGEVVAPAPFPSPPSSSGPPSWVVQVTQESNSMPVQPLPEPEELPTGPQFRSESGGIPTDIGYSSTPSPRVQQQPAPAPVKREDPVVLAPQPEQQVVEYKKGGPAVNDEQRELDSAFLRLADALAKASRYVLTAVSNFVLLKLLHFSPSAGQVGAVLVSVDGDILGEGGNEDAVLEAMQQSGFRFVPPRNGEGIGVTPPRALDPRTLTLYTTSQPEDIRISKAIRNSCIGRVVVQGE